MYYKFPTRFYFSHLEGVDCLRGILINDDHTRYPYLSIFKNAADHGFAEMEVEHFNDRATINQRVGEFEAHEFEGQKFYCSEPHINKVFDTNTKIAENNVRLISDSYRNELKVTFWRGYQDSLKSSVASQLGEEFSSLQLDLKILKLTEFCRYCKELTYFEGFAIPRVIYCIGFIQAAYFKAYAELVNLEALADSLASVSVKNSEQRPGENGSPTELSAKEQIRSNGNFPIESVDDTSFISRIPVAFPLNELKAFWQSITEIPKCKSLKVEALELGEGDVDALIRELFDHPLLNENASDAEAAIICQKFDPSWKVPIGGLLYATKKRIEISGAPTGTLTDYETFAATKFSNCFIKEESNSKGSNLGRSFGRLKEKLQKYDNENFPNIRETLNILTRIGS
jgi:hypothetical protein